MSPPHANRRGTAPVAQSASRPADGDGPAESARLPARYKVLGTESDGGGRFWPGGPRGRGAVGHGGDHRSSKNPARTTSSRNGSAAGPTFRTAQSPSRGKSR